MNETVSTKWPAHTLRTRAYPGRQCSDENKVFEQNNKTKTASRQATIMSQTKQFFLSKIQNRIKIMFDTSCLSGISLRYLKLIQSLI